MRVLVACVLAGCHATTQHVAPPIAVAKPPTTPQRADPPPAFTISFLERTSPPHTFDTLKVDVAVARNDGPEAIDALLPEISQRIRECYTSTIAVFGPPHQDRLTMTIDGRAGETSVEIEPAYISPTLATCFVQSVVASHVDAHKTRIVLAIESQLWFGPPPRAQPPP